MIALVGANVSMENVTVIQLILIQIAIEVKVKFDYLNRVLIAIL